MACRGLGASLLMGSSKRMASLSLDKLNPLALKTLLLSPSWRNEMNAASQKLSLSLPPLERRTSLQEFSTTQMEKQSNMMHLEFHDF